MISKLKRSNWEEMFPFPGLSNQGLKLEANVELKTPKNWPGFEPALR